MHQTRSLAPIAAALLVIPWAGCPPDRSEPTFRLNFINLTDFTIERVEALGGKGAAPGMRITDEPIFPGMAASFSLPYNEYFNGGNVEIDLEIIGLGQSSAFASYNRPLNPGQEVGFVAIETDAGGLSIPTYAGEFRQTGKVLE